MDLISPAKPLLGQLIVSAHGTKIFYFRNIIDSVQASPNTRNSIVFVQQLLQANKKENIKLRIGGFLWREFAIMGGVPLQAANNAESVSMA